MGEALRVNTVLQTLYLWGNDLGEVGGKAVGEALCVNTVLKTLKTKTLKTAKKAPGPYMVFCKEERPKIVKANPGMAFGEIGKALGAAWGKLSDAQKAKYKK